MVSVRKAVPAPLQRAGRQAYTALGARTAQYRLLPDFVVVGAQRSGTTSLFRALMQHPQVLRPNFHKGVNYFDVNYQRGPDWYAGHFPTQALARRRVPKGVAPAVFEASGYYMFHPHAMERMAHDLSEVRLVALLRDPVERAYSAWKHESARGFDQLPFEEALHREDERVADELARMTGDPAYRSHAHRHYAYRRRGDYAEQLDRVLRFFPRSRLHVMYSESFFSEPELEYARLVEFLGLRPYSGVQVDRFNARPSGSMPAAARDFLASHYSATRPRVEHIVGQSAPWPRL